MAILVFAGELSDWVGDTCDTVLMDFDLLFDNGFGVLAKSASQCGPDLLWGAGEIF